MEIANRAMSEIVGNDTLKARLCEDILNNSLHHAYILEGATGSGRHTLAIMTAAALSCENKEDKSKPIPCLTCPTCKKITEKKSPDVIFQGSEGKASIGVDIARFLKEDVHIVPNDLEHKVYIIEDADKLTPQAQNALLLTLEEPPSFVHFFLLCNNASAFLETIKSRAPILRTEMLSDEQIDEYISANDRRAAQMKLASRDEYNELIKVSGGSIGTALDLLDPVNRNPILEQRHLAERFVSLAINRAPKKEILAYIPIFEKKRHLLTEWLILLANALRDLIFVKKSDNTPLSFYCDINNAIELSDKVSLTFLYSFQTSVLNAIEENKRNANLKLLLTKMLITADLI